MKGDLGNLMKQAQKMQEQMQVKMQKAQEELAKTTVVGESGAGLVKITMTGKHDVKQVEIAPDLPKLKCDARRIKQVLINLISNSIKYGKPETTVKVSAEYLESKKQISIEISDHGIGILDAPMTCK